MLIVISREFSNVTTWGMKFRQRGVGGEEFLD